MAVFIALLRAVNVGGTGKLPMAELVAICERAGFTRVQTYIASGNVVFNTRLARAKAKAALEQGLMDYAGKPVGVLIRTPEEMARVRDGNPFPQAAPNRVVVVFLDAALASGWEQRLKHHGDEQLVSDGLELYVHYGDGMAQSKLLIPDAKLGTGRNLNTVARLAAMSAQT